MTKPVSRVETHADLLLAQAVDTLVNTYFQNKTSTDGFGLVDRARAAKLIAARAVKLTHRGWPWKYVPATGITVPQQ